MSEEGFFRRWARLKASSPEAVEELVAPAPVPVPAPARVEPEAAPQAPLPTLEDAARLTPDADFSAFVARGVDKSVQRLALKKLFADPHFRIIDGLDTYMHDYNKAAPLAPAMLASLKHAPDVLSRLLGDQQEGTEAAEAQGQAEEQAPPSTRQGTA